VGQNEAQNAEAGGGIGKTLRTVGRRLLYILAPGAGMRKIAAERRAELAREEVLRKAGKKAKAEILEVRRTRMKVTSGSDEKLQVWELRVRVKPSRGPTFESTARHGFAADHAPADGEIVGVLYDAKDTRTVVVDPHARGPDPAATDAAGPQVAVAGKGRAGARPKSGRKAAAIPGPHAVDRVEQLAKLAELHGSGALSDDEFAARKKEILEG
jgi:hypothetical protein